MDKPVYMLLAEGFEEIEAIATADFLKRLGIKTDLVGVGNITIKGSHGISVNTDIELKNIKTRDCHIILPGGMPGSVNLRDNPAVTSLILDAMKHGNLVAAICAAPIALDKAGVLKGRKHTGHPSVKNTFQDSYYSGGRTETDGNIITAKGPGTSIEFAIEIARFLGKGNEAEKQAEDMFF